MKIEKLVRTKTPEIQIGGQPNKGTRDHLLKCILTMREFRRKEKPLVFVLVDISKCFDKVRLTDLIYEGLKMGCNEAVLEYIYDFLNEYVLHQKHNNSHTFLKDTSNRFETVPNTSNTRASESLCARFAQRGRISSSKQVHLKTTIQLSEMDREKPAYYVAFYKLSYIVLTVLKCILH